MYYEIKWGGWGMGEATVVQARVVILPLPAEPSVSVGQGTSLGPRAIIAYSHHIEVFDEELMLDFADEQVATLAPPPGVGQASARELAPLIRSYVEGLGLKDQFLIGIGGEHSVTLGLVQAQLARHPRLGVLQVDAHQDLRPEYNGDPFSHACVMRRLRDDHGVQVEAVGIRAVCREEWDYMRERGLRPLMAHQIPLDHERWVVEVVERLPEEVYISFDVDGLDPSLVPGTGTPEPGGLTWRQAMALLREVFQRRKVIAADVVEVAPIPGHDASQLVGARLVMKMVAYRSLRSAGS